MPKYDLYESYEESITEMEETKYLILSEASDILRMGDSFLRGHRLDKIIGTINEFIKDVENAILRLDYVIKSELVKKKDVKSRRKKFDEIHEELHGISDSIYNVYYDMDGKYKGRGSNYVEYDDISGCVLDVENELNDLEAMLDNEQKTSDLMISKAKRLKKRFNEIKDETYYNNYSLQDFEDELDEIRGQVNVCKDRIQESKDEYVKGAHKMIKKLQM